VGPSLAQQAIGCGFVGAVLVDVDERDPAVAVVVLAAAQVGVLVWALRLRHTAVRAL
jgi:hypothetical protein